MPNHSNVELNFQINIISNETKLKGFYYVKDKNKIQLKSCNLKKITSIHCHNSCITLVSTFPSGNIISTSNEQSIIIYDIFFNILQNIQNAHDHWINYIDIKDENNFISCSDDKSIKSWIKKIMNLKLIKLLKIFMMGQ